MRFFFEVAYNGTRYHGWQIQQNANTVQEELNKAVSVLFQDELNITGSGRTDTGVHCEQQYFHVDTATELGTEEIQYRLNTLLPSDIAINDVKKVSPGAHARFDAISRSYEYRIIHYKDPFKKELTYYHNKPLDIPTMNKVAALLPGGEKDFTSFSKVKTEVNHFRCTVSRAEWAMNEGVLIFYITANRFLRGMVRAIVGTLIDAGRGKLNIEDFQTIMDKQDRKLAGRAAPPEGLFLTHVKYPGSIFM